MGLKQHEAGVYPLPAAMSQAYLPAAGHCSAEQPTHKHFVHRFAVSAQCLPCSKSLGNSKILCAVVHALCQVILHVHLQTCSRSTNASFTIKFPEETAKHPIAKSTTAHPLLQLWSAPSFMAFGASRYPVCGSASPHNPVGQCIQACHVQESTEACISPCSHLDCTILS